MIISWLHSAANYLGMVGVVMMLFAYGALQLGRLHQNSRIYSLLNFFGACLVLISLCFYWNLSAFVIEFFWALISLYGLLKAKRAT